MPVPVECEVVIVGGGVTGASAAYHLMAAGVTGIVVLEQGEAGNGIFTGCATNTSHPRGRPPPPPHTHTHTHTQLACVFLQHSLTRHSAFAHARTVSFSMSIPPHVSLEPADVGGRKGPYPSALRSGSATMPTAPAIKMMVRLFAAGCQEFITHHGMDGARRYVSATREGIAMQKALAAKVLPQPKTMLRELGTVLFF